MKRKLIALRCAAHRHGVKLEGVKMKKRMTITMLAIVVGVLAACIGTLVEKIDYVVCDGVLHIESSQFWGLQKSSWQCSLRLKTVSRGPTRLSGLSTLFQSQNVLYLSERNNGNTYKQKRQDCQMREFRNFNSSPIVIR